MTFLYFLAFTGGGVLGMFLAHAIGSVALGVANDRASDAEKRTATAYDHAARCESALIESQMAVERLEAELAERKARKSAAGVQAAITRKAREQAAQLANEAADRTFDGDGDTVDFPSPFDEGTVSVSLPPDLHILDGDPPSDAREAA